MCTFSKVYRHPHAHVFTMHVDNIVMQEIAVRKILYVDYVVHPEVTTKIEKTKVTKPHSSKAHMEGNLFETLVP